MSPLAPVGGPSGDAIGAPAGDRIDVIATTISGSLRDQRKTARIDRELGRHTSRPVVLHAVDSHAGARRRAEALVRDGSRTVVSAGGAGTLNAVLEGILDAGGPTDDLRLAVLRKGSADLIGKALGVPDDLAAGAAAIARALEADSLRPADVLAVDAVTPGGLPCRRHALGFGGVGVFGEVPRFTESRFVRWYKGFLGQAFGDLGPFLTGMTLAAVWWLRQLHVGRVPATALELDGRRVPADVWVAVMVLAGDLGPDFPLGRDLALGSGRFRVVALRYRGFGAARRQVRAGRSGAILDRPGEYEAVVDTVRELVVEPTGSRPYGVNVDGLPLVAAGTTRWSVAGRIRLVDANGHAGR